MKIALTTIGCKLNQFETMAMREALQDAGYRIVPFAPGADIYIINTCSVTSRSDYKGRQAIRKALKMKPKDGLVVVTGCQSQLDGEKILELGADVVIGNLEKAKISKIIKESLNSIKCPIIQIEDISKTKDFQLMPLRSFHGYSRAFLKIQDGCNNRCTYCVVWMARGPARSAPYQWVISEAKNLTSAGFREIVLTGIDMGAYRWENWDLVRLAKALIEIPELEMLRFSSIEPLEFSQSLRNLITEERKIAPHVHIPVQSADNEVLKRMGRNYSAEDIKELIWELHKKRPLIGIGVDIIVGFPGESIDAFEKTKSLLEDLPISYMHIFTYSPRPKTKAAQMEDQINPEEKRKRYEVLRTLKAKKMRAFKEKFLGKELRVLIEGRREKTTNLIRGLAENYIPFLFVEDPKTEKGMYTKAKVLRIEGEMLIGKEIR